MQHHFDTLPSALPAYFRILTGKRRYDGAPLPTIEATPRILLGKLWLLFSILVLPYYACRH